MTAWDLTPGEERPVTIAARRRAGSLTVKDMINRAEALGARVERNGSRWHVFPPDPKHRPVFVADRLGSGRDRLNVAGELRRAGLDVTDDAAFETTPKEPDTMAKTPTPTAMPTTRPTPALAEMQQQVQAMLEMLAEAETRDGKLADRLADLEARLDATPGAPAAKDPHADLDAAIVAFLTATPIKLTADVIAVNLPGETACELVDQRLRHLAAADRVTWEPVGDGRAYRLAAASTERVPR